jgi:hypothetical protein
MMARDVLASKALSYRQKVILLFLIGHGTWATTREIATGIGKNVGDYAAKFNALGELYLAGLVERDGSQAHGYRYRMKQ